MIRIKYQNPENTNKFVTQTLDDTVLDIAAYCENIHKNLLCKDVCTGDNCRIWIEVNGEFILVGVSD